MNQSLLCPAVPSDDSCSGRGVCVGENLCDCLEPWTGFADLAWGSPSCAVLLPLIQALWSFGAALSLISIPLYSWRLYLRLTKLKSKQGPYDVAVNVSSVARLVFGASIDLYRAVNPLAVIGTDVTSTLLYLALFGVACFNVALAYAKFLGINVRMMQDDARMKSILTRMQRVVLWLLLPMFIVTAPVFIAMLFIPDYRMHYILTAIYHVGFGIMCLFVLGFVPIVWIYNPLIDIAEAALENARGNDPLYISVYHKIKMVKSLRRSAAQLALPQFFIGLIFAFVPVLNRAGAAYLIPLNFCLFESFILVFWFFSLSSDELNEAPAQIRRIHQFFITPAALGQELTASATPYGDGDQKASANGKQGLHRVEQFETGAWKSEKHSLASQDVKSVKSVDGDLDDDTLKPTVFRPTLIDRYLKSKE